MASVDIAPEPILILSDPEQIRGYVHPTRMSILSILGRRKETSTGIARELGVHPANLTRHLRLLERTGLIRLVEKRDTGRNLEKYYRAAAHAFEVRLRSGRSEDRRATVLSIIRDNLSSAIVTARSPASGEVVGLLGTARIDRERIAELRDRMSAMVREFGDLDADRGVAYSLSLALFPNESPTSDLSGTAEVTIEAPRADGHE